MEILAVETLVVEIPAEGTLAEALVVPLAVEDAITAATSTADATMEVVELETAMHLVEPNLITYVTYAMVGMDAMHIQSATLLEDMELTVCH